MVQDYSKVKSGSKTTLFILVVFCGLAAGLVTIAYFATVGQLGRLSSLIVTSREVLDRAATEKAEIAATPDPVVLENQRKKTAYNKADQAVGQYWEKKDYKEASSSSLLLFANAQTTDEWANAYGWSGHILFEQKKMKDAEVAFKKALELNPRYMSAYNGLDDVYYARKDYKSMLANAEAAIKIKESSFYYNQKGVALSWLNRREEEIAAYRKALELDPENKVAAENLRMSLQSQ